MNLEPSDKGWSHAHLTYWNSIAVEYDLLYSNYWGRAEDKQTRQFLSRVINTDSCKILDLACGTGMAYGLCKSLINHFEYIGLDISPAMLARCREKYPEVIVELGTMNDLSRFESGSFDTVISLYTSFSFTNAPDQTLEEIHRVLKTGGRVFISSLNRWSLRRLLRCKWGRYEKYYTRNSATDQAPIPAWTYSRHDLETAFVDAGFNNVVVLGQSCLAGVVEHQAFWNLNVVISKLMPSICHTLNVIAIRAD
jgi:ubiquinone/menaquinone biosynthesis C-methylase UbiE